MNDPTELDAVIRAFREGDEAAFRELVEADVDVARAYIGRLMPPWLSPRMSAADLVQEACLVAFRRRRDFTGTGRRAFRAWLLGIARMNLKRAIQHHAGKARRDVAREVPREERGDSADFVDPDPTPTEFAVAEETASYLRHAAEELSPDRRSVLRLVHDEGLTLREAAARMGRTHAAVKKLHERALLDLAEALNRLRGTNGR